MQSVRNANISSHSHCYHCHQRLLYCPDWTHLTHEDSQLSELTIITQSLTRQKNPSVVTEVASVQLLELRIAVVIT